MNPDLQDITMLVLSWQEKLPFILLKIATLRFSHTTREIMPIMRINMTNLTSRLGTSLDQMDTIMPALSWQKKLKFIQLKIATQRFSHTTREIMLTMRTSMTCLT